MYAPPTPPPGPGPTSASSKMTCQLLPLGGFVQLSLWNRTWSWSSTFHHYLWCISCHISQHINSPAQVLPFFDCSNISPSLTREPKAKFVSLTFPSLSRCKEFSYGRKKCHLDKGSMSYSEKQQKTACGSCLGTATVQVGNRAEWAWRKRKRHAGRKCCEAQGGWSLPEDTECDWISAHGKNWG